MKERIKNILYLLATVAILMLSADIISFYLFSESDIEVCCDCPDFSKHSEHSHNYSFEDEVFCSNSLSDHHKNDVSNDFLTSNNLLFTDNYCSDIWQPPKNS